MRWPKERKRVGAPPSRVVALPRIKCPINRCTSNFKRLRNLGGTQAFLLQVTDLSNVDGWWPSFIDASGLGFCDTFGLPFFAEIRFEFGKHPEHVEKSFPG